MNDAHFHMVVNHVPIVGILFGIGILVTGMILRNMSLKNTAFVLFVVSAIFAAMSMYSSEGAEELVEDMPNIGHQIIHEHEEIAEKFAIIIYATGFFGLLSLFASYKKHRFATIFSYTTLALALVAGLLTKSVGTTGGEIRHTEIRANFVPTSGAEQNVSGNQEDKDKD